MLIGQELAHSNMNAWKMWILKCICGCTRNNRISIEDIWDEVKATFMVDKTRETTVMI